MKLNKGQNVCVQTVTHYFVGTVSEIGTDYIGLTNAAWIADTGRATAFFADVSKASEVEVFPPDMEIQVLTGSVVVVYPALGQLPDKQK